jgi:competence protein ComEC
MRIFSNLSLLASLVLNLAVLLCIPELTKAEDNRALLSFLNVGEGDSIFLQSQGQSALIDTGNPFSATEINSYLRKMQVSQLNALILTHPHLDHIGAAFFIAKAFRPKLIADNAEDLSTSKEELYHWYLKLRSSSYNYKALKAGDTLKFGQFKLDIIWPPKANYSSDWNTNSAVIRASLGNFKVLLMADGNHKTEAELLRSNINLQANILKLGHHGASDSGSPEFIAAVGAKDIVISVDQNNRYGRPDPNVVNRLRKNANVLLTGEMGHIEYKVDKTGAYSLIQR